jgi:hypothetical protein
MNFFVEHLSRIVPSILLQPRVARIPNDGEQPSPYVSALVAIEKSKGAQTGFLRHVLRVLVVPGQPAREVVRGVQVREHGLLESFASCDVYHTRASRCSSFADS